MLNELIYLCFLITGLCWFFLTVYDKTGLKEYLIINSKNNYYEKLFSCDFCLSIRISSFLLLVYILFTEFQITHLFVPLIVSGFTSRLN